jgi:hypothetical protein
MNILNIVRVGKLDQGKIKEADEKLIQEKEESFFEPIPENIWL